MRLMGLKCGGAEDCLLAYAGAKLLSGISPLPKSRRGESCCNEVSSQNNNNKKKNMKKESKQKLN